MQPPVGSPSRYLIVNADDFGQSPGINRGVIAAHERGIVTSASLMVRWPSADDAAAYARTRSDLSVGLHVDFGEWAYRDETWVPVYQVVATEDGGAVADEVARQLDRFQALVGKPPTHLDSHQHAHRNEPVRSLLQEVAERLGIPLRECDPQIRYSGAFYGQTGKGEPYPQAITVDALIAVIRALSPGITELGCHPGEPDAPDVLDSMYLTERSVELATLCDPRVRQAIEREGVMLRSF